MPRGEKFFFFRDSLETLQHANREAAVWLPRGGGEKEESDRKNEKNK